MYHLGVAPLVSVGNAERLVDKEHRGDQKKNRTLAIEADGLSIPLCIVRGVWDGTEMS